MKGRTLSKALCYIILAVILLFLLFPIYWMLTTSFKTNMEAYMYPPTFFPQKSTVDAYISLFTVNNQFFVYYINNFIVSGITAIICTLFAVLTGYALSRFHFRWIDDIAAARKEVDYDRGDLPD